MITLFIILWFLPPKNSLCCSSHSSLVQYSLVTDDLRYSQGRKNNNLLMTSYSRNSSDYPLKILKLVVLLIVVTSSNFFVTMLFKLKPLSNLWGFGTLIYTTRQCRLSLSLAGSLSRKTWQSLLSFFETLKSKLDKNSNLSTEDSLLFGSVWFGLRMVQTATCA